MNPVWILAKRELSSFFDSLIGYFILVLFLFFTGLFTWIVGDDIFMRQQADLQVFFAWAQWFLAVFIPAITMRQIAEERRSGTLELLLTKDLNNRQLILAKFLACFLMVCITLLFTLPYYFSVASLGEIDHGATISGYFGLLLLSAAFVSSGIFASSLTDNQIVAFLLALAINLVIHLLFWFFGSSGSGFLSELVADLSSRNHFDSISRGVLDSKDLIYFISFILLFLLLSEIRLSKRN